MIVLVVAVGVKWAWPSDMGVSVASWVLLN